MPDPTTLLRWTRKALTTSPIDTARLGSRKVRSAREFAAIRRRDETESSYGSAELVEPGFRLNEFVASPPASLLIARQEVIDGVADRFLEHRFDLLGSGWVHVQHGMSAIGLEGINLSSTNMLLNADGPRAIRVNPANRAESARIIEMLQPGYRPIDWHVDFKSGYRWSETTWYQDVRYGDVRGADVKVPWELGRMQHLPQLALAAGLARTRGDGDRATAMAAEFRNQILDFVAANPPRFGVQWSMPMDIAIRAANMLLAWDLFRAADLLFDDAFLDVFVRSVADHAAHVASNLEWADGLRGNHYLADVVGLLFAAAYLPSTPRSDAWLHFAVRELLAETLIQFHRDGGNFEGSTSYHRFSAEMVTYALAMIQALPESRVNALVEGPPKAGDAIPALPGAPLTSLPVYGIDQHRPSLVSPDVLDRISLAATFVRDITKPDGRVPQIGDNDNGRLFKLSPPYLHAGPRTRRSGEQREPSGPDDVWVEDHLDQSHLVDAFAGLTGSGDISTLGIDGSVLLSLAKPGPAHVRAESSSAWSVRIGDRSALDDFEARVKMLPPEQRLELTIPLPDNTDMAMLRLAAYPDFGIYVFRTDSVYLSIRCGPMGQRGKGGHDHNDQLAIELSVERRDWIRDPGTYVYTPLPDRRNAYRSVRAHFAPQMQGAEPAGLDTELFALDGDDSGVCDYWGDDGFAGHYRTDDGRLAMCRVSLLASEVRVAHACEGTTLLRHQAGIVSWRDLVPVIPFSPGYGSVET